MSQIQHESLKTCTYCEKILHGRSDQRFCNDNCRNTYNRNKRAADKVKEHENMPEIFRIIKKNYQILKKRCDRPCEENESFMTDTSALIAEGFNPKFFTSIASDNTGSKWYCVFEIGFIMGGKDIFIKDFPKQAEIS